MSAPRISLSKLGEFMITANPARRNRIVYDQRFGNPPVQPQYRHFKDPVVSFLVDGARDPEIIYRAIESLRAKTGTKWVEDDAENTALVLERFLRVVPLFVSAGLTFVEAPHSASLNIAGVRVSIQPEILIHAERRGNPVVGAVKFYRVKDDKKQLGDEGGKYAATLLHQWLTTSGPADRRPDPRLCLFVDCWRGTVTEAPANYRTRMRHASAACEQIAAIWPMLRESEDEAA